MNAVPVLRQSSVTVDDIVIIIYNHVYYIHSFKTQLVTIYKNRLDPFQIKLLLKTMPTLAIQLC